MRFALWLITAFSNPWRFNAAIEFWNTARDQRMVQKFIEKAKGEG